MSGLVTMTPTSIDHVGTSASINANGGVDFEGVTSLSLNGVFTGGDDGFDNYRIVMGGTASGETFIQARLRASGSDTSGANYIRQRLYATGTTVAGSRESAQNALSISIWHSNLPNGVDFHLYGPALAQPTATRSVGIESESNAYLIDLANTHSLSTVYDGITVNCSQSITGNLIVMGYAE